MAARRGKSGLASQLGTAGAKAVQTHRTDKTEYGRGSDLPPGIENGVAQLTKCYFKKYEKGDFKGEYFFYAAGAVVEPKTHNKVPIEGGTTQIGPEPMCETEGRSRIDVQDHVAWVLNEMRKLGLDTKKMGVEDLETAAAALQKAQPYFKFRTWQGKPTDEYPNPRVNHTWGGIIKGYEQDEEDGVEDDTGDGDEEDIWALAQLADEEDDSDAQDSLDSIAKEYDINSEEYETWSEIAEAIDDAQGGEDEEGEASDDEDDDGEEEEEGEEPGDAEWLRELASVADEGDGDEQAEDSLCDRGHALDLQETDYDSWSDYAEAIIEAEAAGEEDEEEGEDEENEDEEEGEAPEKGDIGEYKPPRKRKPVEVEVVAVSKTKETLTLLNLDDNTTKYKGVPWEKFSLLEE